MPNEPRYAVTLSVEVSAKGDPHAWAKYMRLEAERCSVSAYAWRNGGPGFLGIMRLGGMLHVADELHRESRGGWLNRPWPPEA